jgi:hypothetical protein
MLKWSIRSRIDSIGTSPSGQIWRPLLIVEIDDTWYALCDGKDCQARTKIERWAMIRAGTAEGWFFRRDDTQQLCFNHLTPGIIRWRDRENPGWRMRLREEYRRKLNRAFPVEG